MKNIKTYKAFNEDLNHYQDEKTKWFIEYGLGGGFGNNYDVVDAYDQKEADDIAYQRACEEYDSHVGGNGIRDIGEIMEEDEVDDEEAAQIFNEEKGEWEDNNSAVQILTKNKDGSFYGDFTQDFYIFTYTDIKT